MYAGIIVGIAVLWFWSLDGLSPWQRFMLGFLAYTPTVAQIYFQQYAFKVCSRFLLGIGISHALSGVVLGYAWGTMLSLANGGFLLVFVALAWGTMRWRARHLDIPCLRCPEGQFPFCSWRHREIREVLRDHERRGWLMPDVLVSFLYAVDRQLVGMGDKAAVGEVEFLSGATLVK